MKPSVNSIDLRCEQCRFNTYDHFVQTEPYHWTNPETGAQILRYGVCLCSDCVSDARELRCERSI